jgi:hypothetical protein
MHTYKEKRAAALGITVSMDGKTVTRSSDGHTFSLQKTSDGQYWRFNCGPKNARIQIRVHRLQAWQKYGDAIYAPGMVCRHLDGNSFNNHRDNIALGTQSDNMMDKSPKNRRIDALRASRSIVKYPHAQVIAYYKQHGFAATLAEFGIRSKGTLSHILNKSGTEPAVPKAERPARKAQPSLDAGPGLA